MGGEDQGARGIAILPAPPAQEDSPCPSGAPTGPPALRRQGQGAASKVPGPLLQPRPVSPLPVAPWGALDLRLLELR